MPRRIPRRRGDEIKRRECRVSKLARIYGALCNTAFLNSAIYPGPAPSTYHGPTWLSHGERDTGTGQRVASSTIVLCSLTLCAYGLNTSRACSLVFLWEIAPAGVGDLTRFMGLPREFGRGTHHADNPLFSPRIDDSPSSGLRAHLLFPR